MFCSIGTGEERVVVRGGCCAGRLWEKEEQLANGYAVVAGSVTVFSLGDMIIYNRRKKREFFAEQQAKHEHELAAARWAMERGMADENQILLLNRERAAVEAEEAKKNRKGIFASTLQFVYGNTEEKAAPKKPSEFVEGLKDEARGFKEDVQHKASDLGIMKAVEVSRKPQTPVPGGPLDQIAADAASSAKENTKSWTSWMTNR